MVINLIFLVEDLKGKLAKREREVESKKQELVCKENINTLCCDFLVYVHVCYLNKLESHF